MAIWAHEMVQKKSMGYSILASIPQRNWWKSSFLSGMPALIAWKYESDTNEKTSSCQTWEQVGTWKKKKWKPVITTIRDLELFHGGTNLKKRGGSIT